MLKLLLLILLHDTILANGQTLIKLAMHTLDEMDLTSIRGIWFFTKFCATNPRIWSGLALNSTALLIWLIILSFTDLSQAYPLDSLQYILIAVFAKVFLKEKVCFLRWLGIAVIVTGVIIVGIK